MKKPFLSLPSCIQKRLLWNMELDYDPYEGSQADTIHSILNDNVSKTNILIIGTYYKAFSNESLKLMVEQERDAALRTANDLTNLITELS